MAKYLVVIEGPGKIKKYSALLGKDYKIVATKGHCIDLPSKGINVKINQDDKGVYGFVPNYQVMDDKKEIVSDLVDEAKKHQITYLMTDPDREGEAIAWHIANYLPKSVNAVRASTNSLTKSAIDSAMKSASTIDTDLVHSYETRRILDRLVGYKCSHLTKTATGGQSVGRVQSAALRLIAEREQEIQNFKPQEYWDIKAELLSAKKDKFWANLIDPDKMTIGDQKTAETIVKAVEKQIAVCSSHKVTKQASRPYAPFTTSTLQQSAATFLGMTQSRCMTAAQKLYENGDITYHRTDSVHLSKEGMKDIRSFISTTYPNQYHTAKPNYYKNTAKNAQEGHEAIRPTDVKKLGAGIDADQKRLYEMIWQRAVSSQMADAQYERIVAEFTVKKYKFEARGSRQLFDGWRKVWSYGGAADVLLPQIAQNEKFDVIDVDAEQKFTHPPPRYSSASFVKTLEKEGIGRPSTFESITKTLKNRGYIDMKGKSFQATDLGIDVTEFLKKANFCFIDLKFSSGMEGDLDLIAESKKSKEDVLHHFYLRLLKDIQTGKQLKDNLQKTNHKCPDCSSVLLMKHGSYGSFLACEDRKGCGFTADIDPKTGGPKAKEPAKPKEYGNDPCPDCGSQMIKRQSKFGFFYGCSNFPECRGMRDEHGQTIEKKKKTFKKRSKKTAKKTAKKTSKKRTKKSAKKKR